MNPELIVALDVPSVSRVSPLLATLPAEIRLFKIGLELFVAEGPAAIAAVKAAGKGIFLDLKLHDIPNTVARAVSSAARHGVALLTVHAAGGTAMLRAAVESATSFGEARPRLLGVTTLTSLGQPDLDDLGVSRPLAEHTLRLGELAFTAGLDGLVCSPLEAAEFRRELGSGVILVTPGIRPAGDGMNDQKRVATPECAVRAGADYLVVGRPVLDAADPPAAARAILKEIREAALR